LIDHSVAANATVLGANITPGATALSDRLTAMTAMFVERGMDAVAAGRLAANLLGRTVTGQATVIAFDTAFNAVALLFVVAAPVLVATKIGISRYAKLRAARVAQGLRGHSTSIPSEPPLQPRRIIGTPRCDEPEPRAGARG
jgi:DHA2 family multidrug resistance protein